MLSTARFLQASSGHITAAPPTDSLDSDVVVILAALLCALICVVGLALVARCACLRRAAADPPPPNKGLKKRALRSLPTATFDAAAAAAGENIAECAICLAEFADGDQIRVLPPCGHGFHAGCVDTWLGAHSSCPSCRRVLVVADDRQCRSCGSEAKPREDGSGGASRFLP